MKTMRVLLLILAVAIARSAAAEEPDAELIAKITGLKPDVKNGIAKVTVPRGDLGAVIDGAKMQPFQGLTSWAAFQAAGDKTIVMGDMTLTEPQVNPTMSAALDSGLQVTALHNTSSSTARTCSSCTSGVRGPPSSWRRGSGRPWTPRTRRSGEPVSGA